MAHLKLYTLPRQGRGAPARSPDKKKLHKGDGTVYYHLLPTELPYHFSVGHFLLLSDDNPEVSAHLSSPPCVSNT